MPTTYTVTVENASGNRRPYQAIVRRADGSFVGRTGYCSSPGRAKEAAAAMVASDKAM